MNRPALVTLSILASFACAPALAYGDARAANDRKRVVDAMAPAIVEGGTVIIPAGDYYLDGVDPIPLPSNATVIAHGARFRLPAKLGDRERRIVFAGKDVVNLTWIGGHFTGHVFDPSREDNDWEPNANTRGILITTSPGGRTERLTFRDVTSDGLAGAAITVLGAERKGSERDVDTFARDITVENCSLLRTGKFMWDYGLLWQITVWPEEFGPREHALAKKYFRSDLVRGGVVMNAGDDRVLIDNRQNPLSITKPSNDRGNNAICFFGDALPTNLVRGKQYFVVESKPDFIRIAETAGGEPIRFASAAGPNVKLIADLFQAHLALYAPTGSGPGKGALDLVGCKDVIVRGCRLSALGDTMHIQKSHGIVFANNQITGSRMGAFFLAEFCSNATITGNTVDGTNGSRVISVEKSCRDVTMVGNTFRNGGRGSWINQPTNFVLADNIFVDNTTKCRPDPKFGRRSIITGAYEQYAELYFTTHEPNGRYGNVIVRGNIFTSGDHASAAVRFAAGGDSIQVTGNIFRGKVTQIAVSPECRRVAIKDNVASEDQTPNR
jgi:hypothetical protein